MALRGSRPGGPHVAKGNHLVTRYPLLRYAR